MRKTVSEYADLIRQRKPEYAHMEDADLIMMATQKNPNITQRIDPNDLRKTLMQSRQDRVRRERQKQFKSTSFLNRLGVGVGKGSLDIFQGMHQIGLAGNEAGGLMGMGGVPEAETAEQYTKRTEASQQPYEEASKGDFASGLGEVAGQIATTAPVAGVVSPLGPVAAGVAEGAAVGTTQFTGSDESRAANTAFSALFGGLMGQGGALVKKYGSKIANAVKKKYKNANIQELMDLAESFDVELSLGDVTGKAGTRKGEVIAESKPKGLEDFRQKGQEKLTKVMKDAVKKYRGKGELGQEIKKGLQSGFDASRAQAKANYDEVKSLAGDVTVVPDNALNIARQHEAEIAEGVLSGDKSQFTTIIGNLEKAEKNFEQLRKIRSELGKASRAAYNGGEDDIGRRLKEIRQGIEYDIDDLVKGKVKGPVDPTAEDMKQYKEIWDYSDTEERLAGYHEYLESVEDAAKYDQWMENLEIMSSKDAPNILRMANFVKMMDGKSIKGGKAGQTYNEHIPKGIFGEGSDVIADRLGMSEDDFMQMLMETPRKPARAIPKVTKNTESIGIKPEELKQTTPPNPKVIKAYKKANKHYREDVVPYRESLLLKRALKTEEPAKIFKTLVGDDMIDRARIFYKALDEKGKDAVRGSALEGAYKKALTEVPQGEILSPAKFATYLDKTSDVKNVFFSKKDQKYLEGLKKVLKAGVRFGQYAENPPTGNRQLMSDMRKQAWFTGGASLGWVQLQKFFWTGKGKKFLLAASELDPASTKMGKIIQKIGEGFRQSTPLIATETGMERMD